MKKIIILLMFVLSSIAFGLSRDVNASDATGEMIPMRFTENAKEYIFVIEYGVESLATDKREFLVAWDKYNTDRETLGVTILGWEDPSQEFASEGMLIPPEFLKFTTKGSDLLMVIKKGDPLLKLLMRKFIDNSEPVEISMSYLRDGFADSTPITIYSEYLEYTE